MVRKWGIGIGKADAFEPGKHQVHRDRRLVPSYLRAEARVDAVPETKMGFAPLPGHVKFVSFGEYLLIAIGCAQNKEQLGVCRNSHASNFNFHLCEAGSVLQW